jgi:hypothetical protein
VSAPSVVEDVFLAALQKATPEECAAYLHVACKDNPDLRRRVERLLEAHPKAGSFLQGPARQAPPWRLRGPGNFDRRSTAGAGGGKK